MGDRRSAYRFLVGGTWKRLHGTPMHIGEVISKWISKEWDGEAWTGLVWLRIGTVGGRL